MYEFYKLLLSYIIELKNPLIMYKFTSMINQDTAEWLRLWVFNVEVPSSNASRFWTSYKNILFFAILISLVVPMLQFLFYKSVTVSLISIKPKRFEVQCLGYPLANFQLLKISGFPCRCNNILVSFFVKNLCQFCLYLNQIWYQNVPYIPLMRAKFEGNLIAHLCFMSGYCKCVEKNNNKISNFLWIIFQEQLTSGRMCSLLICWHLQWFCSN